MKEMEHMWKYKYKHQYSDNKNYTGYYLFMISTQPRLFGSPEI